MAKIFQLPQHKRFNYKPRFYNERDELRKERQELIKQEVEAEKAGRPARLSKDDLSNYIKLSRKAPKKIEPEDNNYFNDFALVILLFIV